MGHYRHSEFSECASDNTRFASVDGLPFLVLSLLLHPSLRLRAVEPTRALKLAGGKRKICEVIANGEISEVSGIYGDLG